MLKGDLNHLHLHIRAFGRNIDELKGGISPAPCLRGRQKGLQAPGPTLFRAENVGRQIGLLVPLRGPYIDFFTLPPFIEGVINVHDVQYFTDGVINQVVNAFRKVVEGRNRGQNNAP